MTERHVLDDSRKFWDAHAERDPLWAVLSDAGKQERTWDVRRFFQTGVNEVALILYQLDSHGIDVTHGCALDFGCGVGRVTQALAPRFEQVVGVDVSSRMVQTATSLNRFPDRAFYTWNDAPHLRLFSDDTFDFIYTNLAGPDGGRNPDRRRCDERQSAIVVTSGVWGDQSRQSLARSRRLAYAAVR